MNVLAISDIHGNAPALRAVLREADGEYDTIVCAGDIVGTIPFNNEVVDILYDERPYIVKGNHDCRYCPDYAFSPSRKAEEIEQELVTSQLDPTGRRWLRELPNRIETPKMVIAHSHPFHFRKLVSTPTGYAKGDAGLHKGDYTRIGPLLDNKVAIVGHTHYQAAVNCSKFPGQSGLVVNPGSVGQHWNDPAEYAIVDTVTHDYDLRSVEYDTDEVASAFRELHISTDEIEKTKEREELYNATTKTIS